MTRWEQLYTEDARTLTAPPSRAVRRAMEYFQARRVRRVLDLGCGAGRDTAVLAELPVLLIGADLAHAGISIARQQAADHAHYLCADARRLPLADASVDGVYCFGLLHEFTSAKADADVAAVMREIGRVLTPGGVLILAALAGEPEAGMPHVRLFDQARWEAATSGYTAIEQDLFADTGCTGSSDYTVRFGVFVKM